MIHNPAHSKPLTPPPPVLQQRLPSRPLASPQIRLPVRLGQRLMAAGLGEGAPGSGLCGRGAGTSSFRPFDVSVGEYLRDRCVEYWGE